MIVIECVPAIVAKAVTENVKIPVIGIGAGPHTTGQVCAMALSFICILAMVYPCPICLGFSLS